MEARSCRLVLVVLLSLTFLTVPLSGGIVLAAEKVKFGPSVKTNPSYNLPMFAAEEKGFWQQQGLDLEWIGFRSGRSTYRAVTAGSLDMGLGGTLSTVRAASRGVPAIIVADMANPQEFAVFVRADSPIKRPQDLKGAKIGVARFGGLVHGYGVAIVRSLGMEKEIKLVAAGGSGASLAALLSGAIDGNVTSYNNMAQLFYKGKVRKIVSLPDYLPKPWADVTVFAHKGFVKAKPKVVGKTLKALFQATDFIMKNRSWAVKTLKAKFGHSEGVAKQLHKLSLRYGKTGKIDRKAMANIRGFLIEYGILPKEKALPVDQMFTSQFVPLGS